MTSQNRIDESANDSVEEVDQPDTPPCPICGEPQVGRFGYCGDCAADILFPDAECDL